jgi:hypothetical protein
MWRLRSLLHIRAESARAGGARIMPPFLCGLLLAWSLYADHNPLVPQPQQVQYDTAMLKLKGLRISFGSSPAPEDRLGATELAAALSAAIGSAVRVMHHPAAGPSIVFCRTGLVDALPGADEHPGAQSREPYELRISSAGVEVRALGGQPILALKSRDISKRSETIPAARMCSFISDGNRARVITGELWT